MIEHIITLFAPHVCIGCQTTGFLLCKRCCAALPVVAPVCYRCSGVAAQGNGICVRCQAVSPLQSVQAAVAYESMAKELVHRLKFGRAAEAAHIMASCIARSCALDADLVVTHVPTATSRVRQRGYDQAKLLAAYTAHLLGAPYMPLLYRVGQARQVGSGRAERTAHMADAFRARPQAASIQHQVLLIDDVITTGSTIEAAARVLHQAGITNISAAAFARA